VNRYIGVSVYLLMSEYIRMTATKGLFYKDFCVIIKDYLELQKPAIAVKQRVNKMKTRIQ